MKHFLKFIIVFLALIEYSSAQIKHSQNISFIEERRAQKVLPYKIDYCPLDFRWRTPNYFMYKGLVDSSQRFIVLELSSWQKKSQLVIIDLETKQIKSIIPIRDIIFFDKSYFYGESLFLKRPTKSENKYFIYSISSGKRIKKLKDKKCPYAEDYYSGLQEILYKSNKGAYIQEFNCKYIIEEGILTVGKYQIRYDKYDSRFEIITKNE
jgi:hypothetical protein